MTDDAPPLNFDDDDPFGLPPIKQPRGPHTGRDHPDTSRRAADKVTPAVGSIRRQVEAFWHARGEAGTIDDEMMEALSPDDQSRADNSYRPRRVELSDANILLDSGRRRNNARGNPCVVWVHRDFVKEAPPIQAPQPKAKPVPDEVRAAFATLNMWSEAMKREGRLSRGLQDAIDTLRRNAT